MPLPAKTRAECTPEESLNYLQMYLATTDLLNAALGKYQVLASDATDISERSLYRAKALEVERDLELLKNQRRAFRDGGASIHPPSAQTVTDAEERTRRLAALQAREAQAQAIIKLATEGLEAFNKIHAA